MIKYLSHKRWDVTVLLILWLFATALNFDKAYHVDDTAYLEMARWIAQHPLHPMSGLLSWGSDYEAIHYTNQPPLYFYLMAGWGYLFGWSEGAMHALMSIFTCWALLGFYRLARIVSPECALFPTALFGLCPAFVVSQNTMVDIPLVALWIEFFRILLDPNINKRWRYSLAGLVCSCALLIKYTSLALLPIFILHIYIFGTYSQLVWIAIPLSVLGVWSGFNYWEYGGIHLAGRPVATRGFSTYLKSGLFWISTLGAVSPFAGFYFYKRNSSVSTFAKLIWRMVLISFICSYLLVGIWLVIVPERHMINVVLQFLFLLSGLGLIALLVIAAIQKIYLKKLSNIDFILVSWIVMASGFIIVLAPFMAVRHVLLVLPPILLLLNKWFSENEDLKWAKIVTVGVTMLLTVLLATADRWYADIYRKEAISIRRQIPEDATVWFNGNWGWQWYAKNVGMRQYSKLPDQPQPQVGDYVITTSNTCCSLAVPDTLKLERFKTITIDRLSRIHRLASINFYASDMQAWGYSYSPIETFHISKVIADKN